jgi:NitT/TauT family transport system permease protein
MAERRAEVLEAELSGLDALELPQRRKSRTLLAAAWPKLAAAVIAIAAWQVAVWTGWRPRYVLPGPLEVWSRLYRDLIHGDLLVAVGITMRRAAIGYAFAVGAGSIVGLAASRFRAFRSAVGSLITGLQTMPSIAWFPLAILLFKLSETAIFFVVVIGAAPSVANGVIAGVDHVQPSLVRVGEVLGARGLRAYRYVVIPASLPSFVAGLKQGWAFAWRSLMAGELLVVVAGRSSIGARLQFAREFSDAPSLLATMVVILTLGILVDALVFGIVDRTIRRRRGLTV